MRIVIETIKHEDQRYPTCGDYRYLDDGTLYITVSDMGNEQYESLVAIHELYEERLTKWKGISEEQISLCDLQFESKRKPGNLDEPGFDKDCIYKEQHTAATAIEMMMCAHAGIDWKIYDETVNNL
ncbi:MAG: hypothetical protein ABUT20_39900 [Bacteroidota bacterium]